MTKAFLDRPATAGNVCKGAGVRRWLVPCLLLCLSSSGCVSLPWTKKDNDEGVRGPSDSMVLRGSGLEKRRGEIDPVLEAELDEAHRRFAEKDFGGAEKLFAKIIEQKKIPVTVAEEALHYEAECQFQVKNYRAAEPTFRKHLKNYRNGQHAQQSIQRLFQIADYWLEGTRAEMQATADGDKSWKVIPASLGIHFSKDMPTVDVEGHALSALEEVRLNDIGGSHGEQACFYIATVKFYRGKYRDADYYFTELYQKYPNSKLAPKAIKQAIICKQYCTGGSCYDCRTVEETRKLLDIAPAAYPNLANKEQDWLERQLISVNLQQADRDFNIAEFYRRTGHPGSAYFYYEIVRRSYPNTKYADQAVARMDELRARVQREQGPDATIDLERGSTITPTIPAPDLPGRMPTGPGSPTTPRMLPPGVAPPPTTPAPSVAPSPSLTPPPGVMAPTGR